MNKEKIIEKAEAFLKGSKIAYVPPGQIGECNDVKVEVIFIVPLALEPGVIIDPPDVRVWVNLNTGEVTLIDQM